MTLNTIIADQNGVTEIYPGLNLDWSLGALPTVTARSLQFGIKGLFFPSNETEVEPAVASVAMPSHDESSPT